MFVVHLCTPTQAYTWDISIESLSCDMMLKYWVIYEMRWLRAMPRCWVARDWVAWQMRSTWVGDQVKQCHNHGLLGLTCWVIFCLDALLFECWKLLRNRLGTYKLWIINSVVIVGSNYGCVKYHEIIDLWYVSLIMDLLNISHYWFDSECGYTKCRCCYCLTKHYVYYY